MKLLLLLMSLVFVPAITFGQKSEFYINYSLGGLCSSSFNINNDGTYNYETGCEASSHVSFGTWFQKKDTIELKQICFEGLKILKITSFKEQDAKNLSVKIFDQTGRSITSKVKIGQYVLGKGVYNFDFDSIKNDQSDFFRDSGIIIIKSFQKLVSQNFEIKVDGNTNFEITINIPNEWVYKIPSNWIDIGNFKLLKTKNSLLSLKRDFIDETGTPVKTEYKKYGY